MGISMENSAKVLLVEDDLGNITLLKPLIESAGCSCTVASTGKETMDILALDTFDLILMDLHLPDTDGQGLCKRVLAEMPGDEYADCRNERRG